MGESAIAVEGLWKRYGRGAKGVDALRDVSLSVAPGEIYGLLGRNGAGKTTLVKILLDIVRADRGAARLRGLPSRAPAARSEVGYLPEDHRFPEYQTGEGALLFHAALSGRGGRAARRRIAELLELVDLAGAARKKVRAYSKGMKQRLGLAQALISDPQVLLLDEPTDGVDPVGRAQVRDLLLRLRSEGRTIFLNSHLLGEIELVCDRVGILDEGRLVEEGTIHDLTSSDLTYTIRTDPAPDDAIVGALANDLAGAVVSVRRVPEGLEVGVKADADIDRAIDLLRVHRFGIRGLAGKRISLEQAFLAAVREPNGERRTGGERNPNGESQPKGESQPDGDPRPVGEKGGAA